MRRLEDLDRAKGLAILLVVFGHLVARADPAGVEWYEPLRRAVYAFHMPFFLYLSGMVAAYSGAVHAPPAQWGAHAAARARRLLVPFFAMGALVLALKLAACGAVFVDNAPSGWRAGVVGLFWETAASPARSVWYIFVLFVYGLAAPVLVWAGQGRLYWLLAAAFLVYLLPLPARVYADDCGRYAVFFALGVAAGAAGPRWLIVVDRYWRALAWLFGAMLGWVVARGDYVSFPVTLFFTGVIAMPVLHGFVRTFRDSAALIFLWLGRYSFMIYLFNTLFIGFAKGLLLRVTDWDGAHFLPFAVALALSGTLGPVALKRVAFRRSAVLDRLTN
jgi:fucose 4-O-acetylase-like acetyltransferase